MSASAIYSAKVGAGEGFSSPAPLAGLAGWTVFKQQQTEIYEITHNLNLSNPESDMQVVATSMTPGVSVVVEAVNANSFRVSAWTSQLAPAETDFMFIAHC
ncbi:hypothetical protein [Marinobacter arenosus]|uniref:hypothetical protein n=1 Tax=Marinobacter arenosus TaxID=2856822 RepID=UPI001C4CE916|nr:hypothetical protein [Marinobacter arenosus]MBW0148956.1 hypothetical protein [Marinobacter arenosus]